MAGRKINGVEGPKGSYSRPTNAAIAKAKKKAMIKRNSAEGPKRSRVKPSPTAMAMARSNPRVVESGVGNYAMTAARAGAAIINKVKGVKSAPKPTPKPSTFRSTTKGVSKVTGGPLRKSKPVKLGPRKRTLTPAEKRAQTIAMKKARATYAAEGPKKSVAAKPTAAAKKSKFTTKRKVGAGLGVAAGGSIVYGANKTSKRSTLPKGSSVGNLVWNGNKWIAKKK